MHKKVNFFPYPYRAHAETHHQLMRADGSYHAKDKKSIDKIDMAPWNGPVIILIGLIPFVSIAIVYWFLGFTWITITMGVASAVSCSAYFYAYDILHHYMHDPRDRWVERTSWFKWLNGHHVLHHKYMGHNFNTVFPFADWCFDTLITEGKRSFDQVTGSAVPNVQPKKPQ